VAVGTGWGSGGGLEVGGGGGGGWRRILPEKPGGGVQPASQNPNPIYDLTKNSIPYLWPLSLARLL